MELVDTHCHIHEAGPDSEVKYDSPSRQRWQTAGVTSPEQLIDAAHQAAVSKLICVGTFVEDSQRAVQVARRHQNVWASIGIHPHEAERYEGDNEAWASFVALASDSKVVAIGECGLDYFYDHAPAKAQQRFLHQQLELAATHDLPVIFHVRKAFTDFWPIFDAYKNLRGVLHSFTDSQTNLEKALERNLYLGVNGIATFTKHSNQLAMFKSIPIDHLLIETDAPYLTPTPYRDTICEPKHARVTAEFLANLRGESFEDLAVNSTRNAHALFGLDEN